MNLAVSLKKTSRAEISWYTILLIMFLVSLGFPGWGQTTELRDIQSEVKRLFQEKRYEHALPLAHRAVHLAEEEYGLGHPTMGTLLFNLGKLYQLDGQMARAVLYYEKALDIRISVLGRNHPDLAASYFGLGRVFSDQCKYDQAEESFNEALGVMERALADNPHVVNNLSRTAHVYRAHAFQNRAKLRHTQGQYSEADNLYGASVRILQSLLGEMHLDLGWAFMSYARLLRDMGRLDEAGQKELLAERILTKNQNKMDLQECVS